METLQELADTMAAIDEATCLRVLRDAADPFERVRIASGSTSAKALAAAIVAANQIDDVWPVLRFHRSMGGEDLFGYLCGSPVFAPWIQGEPGLEVVDFDSLKEKADAWLARL